MNKNVSLIATQELTNSVLELVKHLETANSKYGVTKLLYHKKNSNLPRNNLTTSVHYFTDSILTDLGYESIATSLLPGSNHFSLLDFFLKNPEYDYYWYIEDDVRFNGDWGLLFDEFYNIDADFISSKIYRFDSDSRWFWWNYLVNPDIFIPFRQRISSFNPIYRISKDALIFLDKCLKCNWIGHHEVLIPTLLYNEGFKLMDFGGDGEFVRIGNSNKFYIEGETFRYRPIFNKTGSLPNKLYHPIK